MRDIKKEIEIFYDENVVIKDYSVYGGECTIEVEEIEDRDEFKLKLEEFILRFTKNTV